jgi:hypothetical protein
MEKRGNIFEEAEEFYLPETGLLDFFDFLAGEKLLDEEE